MASNGWEIREFAVTPASDVSRFYQCADGACYVDVDGRAGIGGIMKLLTVKPIRIVCHGFDGKRWGDAKHSGKAFLS